MPMRSASSAISGRSAMTGRHCPRSSSTKLPILSRLARGLPGHYRFTPAKDLADEIEWAKSRRIDPRGIRGRGGCGRTRAAAARRPVRPRLRRLRAGEGPSRPARLRRHADRGGRSPRDTTPRPPRSSEPESAGSASTSTRTRTRSSSACSSSGPAAGRTSASSGDEDQTIYTFTGATSDYLTSFAERHAGTRVIALTENYRSSPEILDAREPAHRIRRSLEATHRDAPVRPSSDDQPPPDRGGGACRHRGGDRDAARRRNRARRDRRARPDRMPSSHRSRQL